MPLTDAAAYWTGHLGPRLAGVECAAALLGPGSEMLGYDDERSTDHDWPPQLTLFTTASLSAAPLDGLLPADFTGLPIRGAVVRSGLPAPRTPAQWLALPWQAILEATGGLVLRDDDGGLTAARRALAWYPDEVWRYVLACQWRRIAQQEAFPGRCLEVGDALGASVITASIVRDVMQLALLQARVWPPYAKWLGTAFARLPEVGPLQAALLGGDLEAAYPMLAARHNALGMAPPLEESVRPYFDRPYLVLGADRFARALHDSVSDPWLAGLRLTGSVDQQVDNTDLLTRPEDPNGVVRVVAE